MLRAPVRMGKYQKTEISSVISLLHVPTYSQNLSFGDQTQHDDLISSVFNCILSRILMSATF